MEDDPMLQVQYGRLLYILEFEMKPFPEAGPEFEDYTTHRLAYILPCRQIDEDTAGDVIQFEEMEGTPVFVHIGVVECLVGRVKTPRGWSIIDRSDEFARTVFNPDGEPGN